MSKKDQQYINKVLSYISCSHKLDKRIREDLMMSLEEKRQYDFQRSAEELLGNPYEVAKEFMENLDLQEAPKRSSSYNGRYHRYGYEYVSNTKILGIPLVHVNYQNPIAVAKGIFAVGPIAIGMFSAGGLSIGLMSFGALALGIILALGGICLSLGIALGGVALSLVFSAGGLAISQIAAVGGLAVAKVFAYGGYASADMAIGGVTKGIVGFFNQSGDGMYMYHYSTIDWANVIDTFKLKITEVYGELPKVHDYILLILDKLIT